MDKLDYYIIKELAVDARTSASDIAKKLDVNERTVSRRITKLTEDKVIHTTSIVDPTVFGYNSIADINLRVDENHYDSFIAQAIENPNVCYIATGWGEANISIETRFKDNNQMYEYINNTLKHTEGVKVINFFIIPKIIYNINQWLPTEEDFKDEN